MNETMFTRSVLVVIVLATCANFVSLPTGRDSRIVLSLAFAAVVCGLWLLRVLRGEAQVARSVAAPVAAFVAAGAFSWIWSKLTADVLLWIWPSFSMVQIAALLVNSLLPLMLLLTASVVRSPIWSERFVWLLIIVGVASLAARTFSLPIAIMLDNGTRGLFVAWSTGAAALLLLYRWRASAWWWRAAAVLLLAGNIYHYFFCIACGCLDGCRCSQQYSAWHGCDRGNSACWCLQVDWCSLCCLRRICMTRSWSTISARADCSESSYG